MVRVEVSVVLDLCVPSRTGARAQLLQAPQGSARGRGRAQGSRHRTWPGVVSTQPRPEQLHKWHGSHLYASVLSF